MLYLDITKNEVMSKSIPVKYSNWDYAWDSRVSVSRM